MSIGIAVPYFVYWSKKLLLNKVMFSKDTYGVLCGAQMVSQLPFVLYNVFRQKKTLCGTCCIRPTALSPGQRGVCKYTALSILLSVLLGKSQGGRHVLGWCAALGVVFDKSVVSEVEEKGVLNIVLPGLLLP